MKFNYKKVATVLGSALMLGSTVALAAAASFTPSSFTDGGLALVVGRNAAISDMGAALKLTQNLAPATSTTTSSSTVEGGDSVKLERSSDKLNLGNSASTVFVTSIDADDMPTLLADGTYTDDDNTEFDYTQKITLGANLGVEFFADSDYKDETPTIGIKLADDEEVLNYTLDFTTHPAYNASALETTTLTLMGKQYYILDVKGVGDASVDNKTTLLDSANSAIITQGETTTVSGKEVSIAYIGSTSVKLTVNGETTNTLSAGGTYKLNDGTYIGVKEILYDAKDTGISKAEISIGTGKLELTNGQNIELNDETVNEITSYITQDSSYKLDKIVLQWKVDDESFVAKDGALTMPGFESVKVSMADFIISSEEETALEASGSDVIELKTTLKDGDVTIPLLFANSTGEIKLIGKDASNRLKTSIANHIFVNETAGDKYVVASWNSTTEAESYYLKVETTTESNVNKVKFTNVVTGDSKTVTNGSDASFGSVVLTVSNLTKDGSAKWINMSINSGGSFHELYTAEGLKVFLPYYSLALTDTAEGSLNTTGTNGTGAGAATLWAAAPFYAHGIYNGSLLSTAGHGFLSYYQFFDEEDKDSNLAGGKKFNATISESGTSNKVHVSAVGVNFDADNGYEIGDSDDYENYVTSDLATKTLYKTGGDQDSVVITYHGEQAYAELYVTAPSATVTPGTGGPGVTTGVQVFYDDEATSFASKNLIVIGGSAVNKIASELLGGIGGGDAFSAKTGVKAGEAIIQSFNRNGKTALLVAGYNAEDTADAVTYLSNNAINVTVGSALKVSDAQTATAITATA